MKACYHFGRATPASAEAKPRLRAGRSKHRVNTPWLAAFPFNPADAGLGSRACSGVNTLYY